MINAVPSASPANNQSVPSMTATPAPQPAAAGTMPTSPANNSENNKPKSKLSMKMILGGILLLIIVVGSGVGLYLSQQTQDVRNQAAVSCGSITCNDGRTAGPDCNAPHGSCEERANDFCGEAGYAVLGEPGSCVPGGGTTCDASSDCKGSCSSSSTGASCGYAGNCSICGDDKKGKRTFVCGGDTNSGCNDAHGSYMPQYSNNSGNLPTITEDLWCTTIQLDAWGPAGTDARVVFIGNNGQICVEAAGCNPDTIPGFWNCNPEEPAGNYSAACTPGTQTAGNLKYDLKVSNTSPTNVGNNDKSGVVYFLGFYGKYYSKALTDNFLGKPTWSPISCEDSVTNGADKWCGYWLKQVSDPQPNVSGNTISWTWDGTHKFAANQKTINEIVAEIERLKALPEGNPDKLPADYKVPVHVEYRLMPDGVERFRPTPDTIALDLSTYACAPKPVIQCNSDCTTNTQCSDALGAGYSCVSNKCRLTANPTSTTCAAPVYNCNSDCTTNAQCSGALGAGYSCVSNKCRLTDNPTSTTCEPPKEIVCNSDCTSNAECTDALGADYSCVKNKCRLTENAENAECKPVEPVACNAVCSSDAQCQKTNSNYLCVETGADNITRCRHKDYLDQATCKKPAPICASISMSKSNPAINDTVTFTCAQVADVDRYEFRVIQPNGDPVTLNATGNQSAPYTIRTSGSFRAECRLCPTGTAECQPWPMPISEEGTAERATGTSRTGTSRTGGSGAIAR